MRSPLLILLAASAALTCGGCVSLENIAPSVTPAMVKAARVHSATTLSDGRRVFVGPCAACHAPDPVKSRSLDEWRIAVDDMAPRSKLDAGERAALMAYIHAAQFADVSGATR